MPSIRDVAKASQVSITTVSKILSNAPNFHVSEETRARVLQTVNDSNYQYTAKKKQFRIGCIMSLTYNSYSDPYFNDILNGIQSYCSSHNAFISLIVSNSQFRQMDSVLEKQLSDLDGLIITELPMEKADFIMHLDTKIVFVDDYVHGRCNIGYNEIYANQLVMNHLINCGYRKIAYIGGSIFIDFDSTPRMMVYRETLRINGIPFDPELIYDCKWDARLCALQVRELLEKHPETEVIFAGSDSLAIVVLAQLNELGLKCPDDIGVVGFNDIDLAKNFSPPLTTLRLPSVEMGELAAKVLIQQIASGTSINMQMLLPVELIERKSTKKVT